MTIRQVPQAYASQLDAVILRPGEVVWDADSKTLRMGDGVTQGGIKMVSAALITGRGYVHNQASAAATWAVTHNLGFKPNVRVYDSSGTQILPEIVDVDLNSLQIKFAYATGGSAVLS